MFNNNTPSIADIAAVTRNNEGNDGFFGGNGWWVLILLLAVFGGWGGGFGFGGFGGMGGAGLQGIATRADINAGFQFNDLQNGIRGIQQGLCDSTYALNNSIMSGFHGVDNAVCTLGYNTQAGFNTLAHQISDCCCQTNANVTKGFCDLQNTVNTTARDIIDSQNAGTRAILDFLTQDKISTLTAENQSLKFAASQAAQNAFITANQEAQTAELIRRLGRDYPSPAFLVPNPNCCYAPAQLGYGGYGGCGGCGGNF